MGNHNIRLCCSLNFDEQKEADIISEVESLNSRHKLGEFLCNLIRLYFDNPEIINSKNTKLLDYFNSNNISSSREKFFKNINSDIKNMQIKIDKMYDMILNMYILSQMGKHIGLSDRLENSMSAQFILEKQFTELQNNLGESLYASPLNSNKIADMKKISEDALEYIINTYSGIVNEIKCISETQVNSANTQLVNLVDNNKKDIHSNEAVSAADASSKDDEDENEYIDFGDADISALSNFFGE